MIVLVMIILVALTVVFIGLDEWKHLAYYSGAACIVWFCFMAYMMVQVSESSVIDKQLEVYSGQNEEIAQELREAYTTYTGCTTEDLEKAQDDTIVRLAFMWPGLDEDTYIQDRAAKYLENEEKIMELDDKKINLDHKKFILYFGR